MQPSANPAMKHLAGLVLLCILYSIAAPLALATTIYFAPTSAGGNTGADCADAYAWTDATHGITGATASWTPGAILFACHGTYPCPSSGANGIVSGGSGTSGNPITVELDNTGGGVDFPCAYWGGNPYSGASGVFVCRSGNSYIVLNGQSAATAIFENTANGTGLANQTGSTGIFSNCSNFTVENVTVKNIYQQTSTSDTAGIGITGCIFSDAADVPVIQDNIVSQCSVGINLGYEGTNGITSATISGNAVSEGCHEITIGDGINNSTASNILVANNTVTGNDVWADESSDCHMDEIGPVSAFNPGSSLTDITFRDNMISSDSCSSAPTMQTCTAYIFLTGNISTVYAFNNLFKSSNSTYESLLRFGGGRNDNTGNISMVSVYNNTLDCGAVGPIGIKTSATGSAPSGYIYKNNAIKGCTWALNAADATTGNWAWLTANNNDYYGYTYVAQSASAGTYTFAQWQTAGFDAAVQRQPAFQCVVCSSVRQLAFASGCKSYRPGYNSAQQRFEWQLAALNRKLDGRGHQWRRGC